MIPLVVRQRGGLRRVLVNGGFSPSAKIGDKLWEDLGEHDPLDDQGRHGGVQPWQRERRWQVEEPKNGSELSWRRDGIGTERHDRGLGQDRQDQLGQASQDASPPEVVAAVEDRDVERIGIDEYESLVPAIHRRNVARRAFVGWWRPLGRHTPDHDHVVGVGRLGGYVGLASGALQYRMGVASRGLVAAEFEWFVGVDYCHGLVLLLFHFCQKHTRSVIGSVHARASAGVLRTEASPLEIESETKLARTVLEE